MPARENETNMERWRGKEKDRRKEKKGVCLRERYIGGKAKKRNKEQ